MAVFGIGTAELLFVAFLCGVPVAAGIVVAVAVAMLSRQGRNGPVPCFACGRPTTPGLPCPHCGGKEAGEPPA